MTIERLFMPLQLSTELVLPVTKACSPLSRYCVNLTQHHLDFTTYRDYFVRMAIGYSNQKANKEG
jgi:hypothetical protein